MKFYFQVPYNTNVIFTGYQKLFYQITLDYVEIRKAILTETNTKSGLREKKLTNCLI